MNIFEADDGWPWKAPFLMVVNWRRRVRPCHLRVYTISRVPDGAREQNYKNATGLYACKNGDALDATAGGLIEVRPWNLCEVLTDVETTRQEFMARRRVEFRRF